MAIFSSFLRPVFFSASRVQHISDLHFKFAEIRRAKKKKKETGRNNVRILLCRAAIKEETTGQKYNDPTYT